MRKVLHEDLIYEILAVVGEIPRGKVASYGQIARLIGRDNNARLVGNVLSHAELYGSYPCHRVVNHAGRPAPNWPEQQHLLERRRRPIQTQRVRGYETIPVGVLTHGYLHYFPVCVCGSIYRGRRPCNPVCLALSPYETVQRRLPVRILSMSA